MQRKSEEIKWHRLDNTANIFPVINNLQFTGVFRIGAVLHEDIQPQLLDQAVKQVIPHFEAFQVQLRTGIFSGSPGNHHDLTGSQCTQRTEKNQNRSEKKISFLIKKVQRFQNAALFLLSTD